MEKEREEAIEKKVKEIIAGQFDITSELKDETSFTKDLNADSLDLTELVMNFEDEFGITIPDEDARKLETYADIKNYAKSHVPDSYFSK